VPESSMGVSSGIAMEESQISAPLRNQTNGKCNYR